MCLLLHLFRIVWEIRDRGPPSDDINASVGDIYVDKSTVPVGVYQNTSTGWTSCWSEHPREFIKIPHPRLKNRFLWTTESSYNLETRITLSYITSDELKSRGGTEKDKQVYLLQDLKTLFSPITTVKTLAAVQAEKDAWLDSSSSSSTTDTESDLDGMSVEEDLCNDGDDEGDDKGTDITLLFAEAESESGGNSVDKANEEIAR